jgi:integrase
MPEDYRKLDHLPKPSTEIQSALPKIRVPTLRHHKASGRSYVTIPGTKKVVYFGPSGVIDTQLAYTKWAEEYIRENAGEIKSKVPTKVHTWAGLLAWWLEECRREYVRLDGKPTGEFGVCKRAAQLVADFGLGSTPLKEISRQHMHLVRDRLAMGRKKISAKTLREYMGRLVRCFSKAEKQDWITSEQFIRLSRWERVRGVGKKSRLIEPIPIKHLAMLRQALKGRWRAIFNFHLYTGQRAETAITASAKEIKRGDGVWQYIPRQHKGRHRGQKLVILLGPRARKAVEPFIASAKSGGLLFPTTKGGTILKDTYRNVFVRRCHELGIPAYTPRQIRHTSATYLKLKGVDTDVIGAILGHQSGNITLRYAQITESQRSQIVERYG